MFLNNNKHKLQNASLKNTTFKIVTKKQSSTKE